jgi:hypothetical protein
MMAPEITDAVQWARDCGWSVTIATSGHVRFFTPAGRYVVDYPGTASSQARLRNTIAALRRAGLQWPPPSKKERRSQRRKGDRS